MNRFKATVAAVAIAAGIMLTPVAAHAEAPAQTQTVQAVKASSCPWWVWNGYWRVIWYAFTYQCR